MKLNIKTTSNTDLTDALREYVETKVDQIEKFLDKNDESIIIDFEIGKTTDHHRQGGFFRAEINLQMAGSKLLRAEVMEEDQYAAIDKVKDEMVREVRRARGKKEALFRRGARRIKKMLRFGREE